MAEELYKIEIEVSKSDLDTINGFARKFQLSRNQLLIDVYKKALIRFQLFDAYKDGGTDDYPRTDDHPMIKKFPIQLMKNTIGLGITELSNFYDETTTSGEVVFSYHKIEFRIDEEDPDAFAIGVMYVLSTMSFNHAAPRGYSEKECEPDEDWNLANFMSGLDFEDGHLRYYGGYVSGRMMKTGIIYNPGGKVFVHTVNRGKSADRWLLDLQGKSHIKAVKK